MRWCWARKWPCSVVSICEARKAYVRAAPAAHDEELAEQATRVAFEHQQWTLVQTAAERWLELNQTNEEARRFAAFAALHLYQIDRAAEHLEHAARHGVHQSAGRISGAAAADLPTKRAAAARRRCCSKLVVKYPDLTEAHYALAQAAVQSDNFALALEHAQKARELGRTGRRPGCCWPACRC